MIDYQEHVKKMEKLIDNRSPLVYDNNTVKEVDIEVKYERYLLTQQLLERIFGVEKENKKA